MPTIFFTLYFDAVLEGAVRRLWDALLRAGVDGDCIQDHRPHITLAAFALEESRSLDRRLALFARRRSRLPIRLHHIGIFPEESVVFLAPREAPALRRLHRSILEHFSRPGDPPIAYENLREGNWVPHCTLAQADPDSVGAIVRSLQAAWEPLCGTADGTGILEPPDTRDRLQAAFRPPARRNRR